MIQLLEQRLVTPVIGIAHARGVSSPFALLATLYMLAASLPRKLINIATAVAGHDDMGASNAAGSATADAGDDAVEAEYEAEAEGEAEEGECTVDEHGNEDCPEPEEPEVDVSAEKVMDAGLRVTRLMGRAMAAKEAGGKALGRPTAVEEEEEEPDAADDGAGLVGMQAVARLRRKVGARKQENDDAGDDDDDGGDDD